MGFPARRKRGVKGRIFLAGACFQEALRKQVYSREESTGFPPGLSGGSSSVQVEAQAPCTLRMPLRLMRV